MSQALRLRSLAIGAALAALTGCVLMVGEGSDLGPTCHFEGEDRGTCGVCIAAHCRAHVNACCGDSRCRDTLSWLDGCSEDKGADCAMFQSLNSSSAAQGPGQRVSACIQGSCSTACSRTK
ncbi:hypothetical protein [Pendulispora albinea]|uniref:Lipoprotein n=1 Tax=Pendulispora albinea TaxID=2741071 RepID=A0ABZ2M6W1_9BACT